MCSLSFSIIWFRVLLPYSMFRAVHATCPAFYYQDANLCSSIFIRYARKEVRALPHSILDPSLFVFLNRANVLLSAAGEHLSSTSINRSPIQYKGLPYGLHKIRICCFLCAPSIGSCFGLLISLGALQSAKMTLEFYRAIQTNNFLFIQRSKKQDNIRSRVHRLLDMQYSNQKRFWPAGGPRP